MVYAFVEAITSFFNLFLKGSCLTEEFLMKDYITHDSAEKYPPIRESQENPRSTVNDIPKKILKVDGN